MGNTYFKLMNIRKMTSMGLLQQCLSIVLSDSLPLMEGQTFTVFSLKIFIAQNTQGIG